MGWNSLASDSGHIAADHSFQSSTSQDVGRETQAPELLEPAHVRQFPRWWVHGAQARKSALLRRQVRVQPQRIIPRATIEWLRLARGHRADAIVGDQSLGVWKRGGNAGRGYSFSIFEALGDGQVQFEKLGQQVLFGGEAVVREDGGIQGGVGVLERVRAGQFEGTVEGAQKGQELMQSSIMPGHEGGKRNFFVRLEEVQSLFK